MRMDRRNFIQAGAIALSGLSSLHAIESGRQNPLSNPDSDWPMLGYNASRSGSTSTEIHPPFERKWYRLFPDEGLMSGIQPIIRHGKLFVGTLNGRFYALDTQNGGTVWSYPAGNAILHTCAVDDQCVYFGCADGVVYALQIQTGRLQWTVQTGAAIWNAPAIYDGKVIIGSRDGFLYAIKSCSGKIEWKRKTDAPIISSPAIDQKLKRVYTAAEDMKVYAFSLEDGKELWQSPKLPGVSFRGYYPVVAPDGSVMITSSPALPLDTMNEILLDMVKELFGDFASWRHTKEENNKIRQDNFEKFKDPKTYDAQLNYIRGRLSNQPEYQSFFVLNPENGHQKFITPIVFGESMNGTGAPPLVTPDGKVIVKFQALLRSRYEQYSPFLNVGYLNTENGYITPLMDQTRTYIWHDGLLLVHDEQCQLTVGGNILINTHQDNVNALDLLNLKGYDLPFCWNVHEPKEGQVLGIWKTLLHDETLPVGQEWLCRGTAVYGGGSVIDTSVSIAGDSFYFLPTHELSAGSAIIAYKMQPNGSAANKTEPLTGKLSGADWEKIKSMPWDWDILEAERFTSLTNFPAKVPGTRQLPLSEKAKEKVSEIRNEQFEALLWEIPACNKPDRVISQVLQNQLADQIHELISTEWRPLLSPPGKHPLEAYRFFTEPTELVYTLARAYPYLADADQKSVKDYIQKISGSGNALEGAIGKPAFAPAEGENRANYAFPPENLLKIRDEITRHPVARIYPIWLWAHVTGDWIKIKEYWDEYCKIIQQEPNKIEEDCRNGYIAGLIAFCRMAKFMNDDECMKEGRALALKFMRERLEYEFSCPNGGVLSFVPVLRTTISRWKFLTPEVGKLCSRFAGDIQRHLINVYVDYHRPTWWLAWNVEILWRNESPFAFPSTSMDIFSAKALSQKEETGKLRQYLDIPWCKGDLYYIQKLVHCLEAGARK